MIKFISNQNVINTPFTISTISELLDYFENKELISLDSETEGYDPHTCNIISLQLGDPNVQFVIDYTTLSENEIQKIKSLLESDKTIIMHNAQFDLRFLLKQNIDVKNIYDTFLAELVLYTGYDYSDSSSKYYIGTSLYNVVKRYCEKELDKSIRGKIHYLRLNESVIKYAAEDVKYLEEVRAKQLKLIKEKDLENTLELENQVVRVFAKMSFDGIKLDTNKWESVYKITETNVKNLTKELDNIVLSEPKLKKFIPEGFQQNLFGFEERKLNINWKSPIQKLEILNELGINIDSVGTPILSRLVNKHTIIPKLLEYSKQVKLADAFGKKFLDFVNNRTKRLHISVWQILSTGRISVSNPNLNQIPRKGNLGPIIRSAFVASDGYKIVGGDYSSFELAIIAEFSKDPIWVNTLLKDKNLHSELCANTFNMPIKDINNPFPYNKEITYRDVQKTIDFGLAYGMSEFKLSNTIQVSVNKAKEIINSFFNMVPHVKKFLTMLGNFGKNNGYTRTAKPFKRIRHFPEWEELKRNPNHPDTFKILGEIERKSKNTPIQGTNADIIKLALINTQKEIDKNNWPVRILLSIYDEIQTECREDKAEEWKNKLQEIMISTAKTVLKIVPVKADCDISDYWKK